MVNLSEHMDKNMLVTLAVSIHNLIGFVSYIELKSALVRLDVMQRADIITRVLVLVHTARSFDQLDFVNYQRFILEYLLGEIRDGVEFSLSHVCHLELRGIKTLREVAALAWHKEWGGPDTTIVFCKLPFPFWLQLHVAHRGNVQPKRLLFQNTVRSHRWAGNDTLDVAESALIADGKTVSAWSFLNGNGSDGGGVSRDFYASGGDTIRETIMELRDGYLVPKADVPLKRLQVVGALMARSVFIDYHCMGLEVHPAILMYLVCAGIPGRWQSLEMAEWQCIHDLLGDEWCKLLAPLATQRAIQITPQNSCEFWTEMRVHFRHLHSQIAAIVDGWRTYAVHVLCPKVLDTFLRGDRSCDVEKLLNVLRVVNGVDGDGEMDESDDEGNENFYSDVVMNLRADIYRASFEAILRRWSLEKRRELYRFWFGTEQPDLANGAEPCIYIYRNQGREYAISHTCSNSMELTWIETFDPEEVQRRIERMLELSIDHQRVAREAGHLFQIA